MKGLLLDTSTQARRQIGHTIARLWYRLQSPYWDESYVTQYANEIWINKVTKKAVILYDENVTIPLRTHNQDGTDWGNSVQHIAAWVNTRFPGINQEQIDFIKNWIKNNDTCTIDQLILKDGGTPVNLPPLPAWASVVDPATLNLPEYDEDGNVTSGDSNWERSR